MKTGKKLFPIFLKRLSSLVMMLVLFTLASCIQAPSSTRKSLLSSSSSNNNSKTSSKLPEFTEGNNFIQNGGVVYTSAVNFDLSFADTLQLRGKDVDTFIRNTGTTTIACLTGRFNAPTVMQINVMAAMPHSVYNFSTQTLEYYYSLAPSDETNNKNFCQKSGLINKLFSLYPTFTPTYKISALCPTATCVSSVFTSQPLELYTQSGSPITQISTMQLTYTINNSPNISTPIGQSCVTSSECVAQGYSCCSLGQCVKDLALRPNVNQNSADYIQALQDILNNPNHIYNYPQYYFICTIPTSTTTPGSGTTTTSPATEAAQRLKNLEDLYNCTNKIEGEMGICTKTITDALINTTYSAGRDDRNFSSTYTNQSTSSYSPTQKEDLISIQEVSYGEVVLFNYDQINNETALRPDPYIVSSYLSIEGLHNDDTATGASIKVTAKPPTAVSSTLVIKYKIDASCTALNTVLGKCEKYYIQGQQKKGDTNTSIRTGRVTDHFPASNIFKLPYYAHTGKTITVEVDGIPQRQDVDWELSAASPPSINFLPSSNGGMRVFDGQKVKITFYTDLSVNHVLDSKLEAQQKIKDMCHCADLNCGIRPVTNTSGTIVDYACVYPDANPVTPPLSQQIYLSSKTVPVRYFDTTGVSKASVTGSTLTQEGKAFSYRKDNLLNPVNMPDITGASLGEDTYVGFNEIYGSLSYSNGSAKAAKEVTVTKGKTYDIYVDNGTYSNCVQCGNDYNSQLNKLFPLTQFGGGVVPLQSRTNRNQSNGIRADDFSFGRACFIPATMIPWTHSIASDAQEQRMNRMRAQHFFYANGYQRDWYGFDYGAVIGSFDGVRWFAIGTNRRIKADTNKLFIAVNGPFGDLALESTFTVTINDAALNPVGTNMISSDLESDGAQCQKFHQCTTDNDCATTLGWDYICTSVNETTTSWPRFDDNAKEIPDAQREDNRLTSILNLSTVGKRCVYRGRGAACTQNYLESAINPNSTFNQATDQSQHTCSSNNYCQAIMTGGTLNAKFNNRISRYGKVRTDATSDSYGLGVKVPGRPMEFNAVEQMRSETAKNFNSNKIAGLCIPGRTPEVTKFVDQHTTQPPPEYMGDRILGIGMTYRKNDSSPEPKYLAACSVMDDNKNYYYAKGSPNTSIESDNDLILNSGTQNISTNTLHIFSSIFNTKGLNFGLYKNNSDVISTEGFTENRCMRAPGASCFSDLDCAPSKVIADKIKMLSPDDTTVTNILNKYEVKFWQEELVCSQSTAKSDPTYKASNNRCCREVGKTISIATADSTNNIFSAEVPGIDFGMSDGILTKFRYSRIATVYKDVNASTNTLPALTAAGKDKCTGGCVNISTLDYQYKTFSAYGERTSCTGDWVRNFETGNHKWESAKLQTFDATVFRCFNWLPGNQGDHFTCAGMEKDDPACTLIQTTPYSGKAKGVLNYLAKLELTGIPQIAVESEEFFNGTTEGDLSCRSFPVTDNDQNVCYPGHSDPATCHPKNNAGQAANVNNYAYPPELVIATATKEYTNSAGKHLYSADDMTNFPATFKKVFKSDEIVGCYPAGTVMTVGADPALCCTGFINGKTNKCQLQDFVDVSVYTNRYVSSEAKKINANLFDQNGYIKDPSYVAQLACEKSMCASGALAYGVLISKLKVPGQETLEKKPFRFLENTVSDDTNGLLTLYKKGLKLNTHAYCIPSGTNGGDDLTIISCGN